MRVLFSTISEYCPSPALLMSWGALCLLGSCGQTEEAKKSGFGSTGDQPAYVVGSYAPQSHFCLSHTEPLANGLNGSGTESDPFIVCTPGHLTEMASTIPYHYRLAQNINLNLPPYNTGAGWTPIDPFYGVFDGGGYAVVNLYINNTTHDKVGLFGSLTNGAHIHDLSLHSAVILNNRDETKIGTLAAQTEALTGGFSVTIQNVHVTGQSSISDSSTGGIKGIGGLIGKVGDASITQSSYNGTISAGTQSENVGGLVGETEPFVLTPSISFSSTSGSVTGGDYVGGLIGDNLQGEINDCSSTMTVNAAGSGTSIGGIFGDILWDSTFRRLSFEGEIDAPDASSVGGIAGTVWVPITLEDVYAQAHIDGDRTVGGIVGEEFGSSTIRNAYFSGTFATGGVTEIGGVIGLTSGTQFSNIYWNTELAAPLTDDIGNVNSGGVPGNDGNIFQHSTADMLLEATYTGFDFTNTWLIDATSGLPELR